MHTFLPYLVNVDSLIKRSTPTATNNSPPFPVKLPSIVYESLSSLRVLLNILTSNDTSLCSKATEALLKPKVPNVNGKHERVRSCRMGTICILLRIF